LIVEDKSNSEINQYGELGVLIINECAMQSLYVNGIVAYAQITSGHLVVAETGEIELVYKNSNKASDAMVETVDGGVVHHAHASSKSVSENKDENNEKLNVVFDYDYSNIVSETTVDHTTGEYATENGWTVEKAKEEIVAEAKRKEVVNKYKDAKTWVECVDTDYSFAKGNGTKDDPYQVSNPTDLAFVAYMVNAGDESYAKAYYVLTCDIALAERSWYPIGTFKYPFHGYIDGNNKTISGLTATDESMIAQNWFTTDSTKVTGASFGLIGIAGNGDLTIKDLTFTNVNINLESGNCVGTVLGYAPNNGDFNGDDNDPAKANGIGKGNSACNNITIDNVSVKDGTIYAMQDAGGIAGKIYGDIGTIKVTNCTNNANISILCDEVNNESGRAAGIVSFISNSKYETSVMLTGNVNNGSVLGFKYGAGITNVNLKTKTNVSDNTNNGVIECKATSTTTWESSIVYFSVRNLCDTVFENNIDTANKSLKMMNVYIDAINKSDSITLNENIDSIIHCYGTLTINGGNYKEIKNVAGGTVVVNGGTINHFVFAKGSSTTINGGYIEGTEGLANAIVKGGTFTTQNLNKYIDNDNYYVICINDGKYEVIKGKCTAENEANYEAKVKKSVNDTDYYIYYKNVENAFKDGNICLLKDITDRTANLVGTITRSITTNGHSLKCTIKIKDDTKKYSLTLYSSGNGEKVTIEYIEAAKLTLSKSNTVIKGGNLDSITINKGNASFTNTLTIENNALNGVVVTMGIYNSLVYGDTTITNGKTAKTKSHTISVN